MPGAPWQARLLELLGRSGPAQRRAMARLFYLVVYQLAGYRKGLVLENLGRAFPQESATGLTILSKKYYRQLAEVALEIAHTASMTPDELRRAVQLDNPELVRRYSGDFTAPVLLLALHQGNWEWLLSGTALALGQPLDVIYKPLPNRALDTFMVEVRGRFGCRPVPVAEAAADLLRRRREPRLLAMAADQAPAASERRLDCEFFGCATSFHNTPAELAARTGMPVLFAGLRRESSGRYRVRFEALTPATGSTDAKAITRAYAAAAEQAIRAEPESWLWSHRRWKHAQAISSQLKPED